MGKCCESLNGYKKCYQHTNLVVMLLNAGFSLLSWCLSYPVGCTQCHGDSLRMVSWDNESDGIIPQWWLIHKRETDNNDNKFILGYFNRHTHKKMGFFEGDIGHMFFGYRDLLPGTKHKICDSPQAVFLFSMFQPYLGWLVEITTLLRNGVVQSKRGLIQHIHIHIYIIYYIYKYNYIYR